MSFYVYKHNFSSLVLELGVDDGRPLLALLFGKLGGFFAASLHFNICGPLEFGGVPLGRVFKPFALFIKEAPSVVCGTRAGAKVSD